MTFPAGRVNAAALAVTLAMSLAACGGSGQGQQQATATPTSAAPTPSPTPTLTPPPTPTPTPTPDPGELPQTEDKPSGADPAFQARMQQLWAGVVDGDLDAAHTAFFPVGAYRQIKAVNDPDGDWRDRLVGAYDLDLAALRDRVGPGATLVSVTVPDDAAQWVLPGQEYNKGPYWRVYGTRLNYRTAAGVDGSVGITSLISWRGQWYAVHLGPIDRPDGQGAITP